MCVCVCVCVSAYVYSSTDRSRDISSFKLRLVCFDYMKLIFDTVIAVVQKVLAIHFSVWKKHILTFNCRN